MSGSNGADTGTAGRLGNVVGTEAVSVESLEKTFSRYSLGGARGFRRHLVHALRGISFRVNAGEMVGILGPNGAGKTTLLKIIATLIYPTLGSVRFFGQDNRSDEIHSRGMLGLVTCDERSFYWRLTGRANLRFFGTLYGMSARDTDTRIDELLQTLGLTAAADRRFDSYSAGMKQKLAIARGLLRSPQIVLYDEPTRSLDPLSQLNMHEWLRENRRIHPEQTHLFATHNLHEAEELCDRMIIVSDGRIVADGTVDQIRAFFGNECLSHVITLAGPLSLDECAIGLLPGVLRAELTQSSSGGFAIRITTQADGEGLSSALLALVDLGGRILACETEAVSLDDLFCMAIRDGANSALSSGSPR